MDIRVVQCSDSLDIDKRSFMKKKPQPILLLNYPEENNNVTMEIG